MTMILVKLNGETLSFGCPKEFEDWLTNKYDHKTRINVQQYDTRKIRRALDRAGYMGIEPTPENLIDCFLDYVDSGVFRDMDTDHARDLIEDGEITINQICQNLIYM